MRKLRARSIAVLLALAALVVVSCSESDSSPADGGDLDTTPPSVVSLNPQEGTTDVGLIRSFEIAFSESLDPATLGNSAVHVGSRDVGGYVSYDASTQTVSFTPDTLYAPNSSLEIVVESDVTDLAGNQLAEPRAFEFETGPLDESHLQDAFDPNETIAEAEPIELLRYYRTLALWGDDTDVFEFTVSDTLQIQLTTILRAADDTPWRLAFRRSDGKRYWGAGSYHLTTNSYYNIRYTFLPGTYYACVGDTTVAGYVVYDLKLYVDPACPDDVYEDNDFADEATPVAPGMHTGLRGCEWDRDFYAVDLDAGETLSVTLTGTGLPMGYHALCDPSGNQVTTHSGNEDLVEMETTAVVSGTHFILVRFTANCVQYDMDVEVSE